MKFKLFSIALAAAAFASCSSDDLTANGTAQTQLGENEVFAYIDDPDASATTRAGWAIQYTETGTIKQQAMFQTGDVFKMYKSNTWKPQMLKFKNEGTVGTINGGVFEWVDANSKYNDGTDATDMTNREYAVFPANNSYADMSFVDENRSQLKFKLANVIDYGYFTGRTSTVKDGYTIFPSIFPLFGFADENDNVKFNYMTTIIRVAVQGLAAGEHYLLLQSTDRQVSGEFLSKTDDFNAADYTSEDLPVFNTKAVATETATEKKSLKVTFNIPEASAGKDQCIFLPLPTGQYNLDNLKLYLDGDAAANKLDMTLTYKNSDGDYIPATTAGVSAADVPAKVKENYTATGTLYKFDRGIQLLATKAAAVSYTVSELSEINEKLITLASFGRSVEATFTLSGNITVQPASASTTDRTKYLIIPELKNNVTLKFEAASDVTIGALPIKDNGTVSTAKKLTFELGDHVTMDGDITYNSKQNFVAKGATDAFDNLTIVSGAGKVEIGTGFSNSTVTVPENGSLTVNTTNAADVVNAITLTKAATSVEIKKGTVMTLTLPDAAQTITMTGGKIATLAPAPTLTAARAITLNTSGAAEIGTITNATSDKKYSYTFNATWNDDTETAGATAQQNIYTAAQLKAANGTTPDNYVLYADVTISMTKKPFSGVTALTKALNGNGKSDLSADATGATAHSIIGLPAPLFGTLSANVSNLNLKGVNIVGKNIKDAGALASKVNGTVALSNVNVLANGTTASVIGSAATYANTTAINVGGLVGVLDASSAAASLTISNCQVNATIRGYANLGGYVGKMVSGTGANTATINVNKKPTAPGTLTFAKTLTLDVLEDMTSGTIGAMIGTVEGNGNDITIGNGTTEAFANYFTTNIVPANFSFSQNVNEDGKSFVGMPNHEIGFSTGEVADGKLKLYGVFKEGTPEKNFTIKTATDGKVVKVNIYE